MGAKKVFRVSITKAENMNWGPVGKEIWDINKKQIRKGFKAISSGSNTILSSIKTIDGTIEE